MRSEQFKSIFVGALFLLLTLHLLSCSLFATAAPDVEQQTHDIAAELRCPVCQNLSVADSPSELAQEMRALVREQVEQGKSPEEIRKFFVSKYGDWVLLAPPAKGFSLVLWVLPGVAALCGLILVVFALRRWAKKKAIRPADAAAPYAPTGGEDRRDFLAGEQSRLESEIAELEFDFQSGKLSEADYAALSREMEAQRAAIARQLTAMPQASAPRDVAAKPKPDKAAAATQPRTPKNWQLAAGACFLLILGLGLGVLLTQSVRSRDSQGSLTGDFLTGTKSAGGTEALLAQGRAAVENGNFPQAIDAFKKVLGADPNNAEANAYMGLMLSQAGHGEGAIMAFDRSLAADPNFPLALWGKGMLLFRTGGDPKEAKRLLEKVSGMMPAGPEKTEVETALGQLAKLPAPAQAAQAKPQAPAQASSPVPTASAEGSIEGVINIDPKAKSNFDNRSALFIMAKSARAGGPPLAVKKISAPKFPLSYTLSAKDVMMPGAVFSGKLYISARLDKDGDAMTQEPENLSGEYGKNPVEVGSKKIDFVLAPARSDSR